MPSAPDQQRRSWHFLQDSDKYPRHLCQFAPRHYACTIHSDLHFDDAKATEATHKPGYDPHRERCSQNAVLGHWLLFYQTRSGSWWVESSEDNEPFWVCKPASIQGMFCKFAAHLGGEINCFISSDIKCPADNKRESVKLITPRNDKWIDNLRSHHFFSVVTFICNILILCLICPWASLCDCLISWCCYANTAQNWGIYIIYFSYFLLIIIYDEYIFRW